MAAKICGTRFLAFLIFHLGKILKMTHNGSSLLNVRSAVRDSRDRRSAGMAVGEQQLLPQRVCKSPH
jgi:hypothetical protein